MLHRPLSADAAFRAAEDTAAAIAMKTASSTASASLLVPQSGSQGGEKYRNENDMEAHISGGDKIKSQAGGLLEDDTPVLTTDGASSLNLGADAADTALKKKLDFDGRAAAASDSADRSEFSIMAAARSRLESNSAVTAAAAAAVVNAAPRPASDSEPAAKKARSEATAAPTAATAIAVAIAIAAPAPNPNPSPAPPSAVAAAAATLTPGWTPTPSPIPPASAAAPAPTATVVAAKTTAAKKRGKAQKTKASTAALGPAAKKAKLSVRAKSPTAKKPKGAHAAPAATRLSPRRRSGGGGSSRSRGLGALTERQQIALVMKESRRDEILQNINKKNSSGETPLHQEVIKGDLELVAFLIEHNAPLNTKDYAGWSPLHEACNHGFFDIAKMLIENGANVNVSGCDNVTPLHDAAMNSHLQIVQLLISSGAKIDAVNKQGMTPLHVAAGADVVEYLEDHLPLRGKTQKEKELESKPRAHAPVKAAATSAAAAAGADAVASSPSPPSPSSYASSSTSNSGRVAAAAAASASAKDGAWQQHKAAPKLRTVTSSAHVLSPPKVAKAKPAPSEQPPGQRQQQQLSAASKVAHTLAQKHSQVAPKPKLPAVKAKPQQLSAKVAAAAKGNKMGMTALQKARGSSGTRMLAAAAAARARAAQQQQQQQLVAATRSSSGGTSSSAATAAAASESGQAATAAHAVSTSATAGGSNVAAAKAAKAKAAKVSAAKAAAQAHAQELEQAQAARAHASAAPTAAAQAAVAAAAANARAATPLASGASMLQTANAASAQMVALMYQQVAQAQAHATTAAQSNPTFAAPGPLAARAATKPASLASPPSAAPWRQSDVLPPQRSKAYTPPQIERQPKGGGGGGGGGVKSTKSTRRNPVALAKKLDRVQDSVASLPPGYDQFLTKTRAFYEAKAVQDATAVRALGGGVPESIPPGLAEFYRTQQGERDAAYIAMCRDVDSVQLGYERGVIRAYNDAHHCINGHGGAQLRDPSYYEKTHTLEFVMGAHGGLVVDLAQTVSLVHAKYKQAAEATYDRHVCEAQALEAMQMMAWSLRTRARPVVPEVQPLKAMLIRNDSKA